MMSLEQWMLPAPGFLLSRREKAVTYGDNDRTGGSARNLKKPDAEPSTGSA